MIDSITQEELKQLSVIQLAERMDNLFVEAHKETYGEMTEKIPLPPSFPKVKQIIETKIVSAMDEGAKRKVCWMTFNFILQGQYSTYCLGLSNSEVFGPTYSEDKTWGSTRKQIKHSALTQFHIISSRIEMEYFMHLIYFLGQHEELDSKHSTFKKFKKWLLKPGNPFSYFARHVLKAFYFDRAFRSPEIHAGSNLSGRVLRMGKPSQQELNDTLELSNIIMNTWPSVIEILEGQRPRSISGDEEDMEWLDKWVRGDEKEIEEYLQGVYDNMAT